MSHIKSKTISIPGPGGERFVNVDTSGPDKGRILDNGRSFESAEAAVKRAKQISRKSGQQRRKKRSRSR